jgi:hypothetical protein
MKVVALFSHTKPPNFKEIMFQSNPVFDRIYQMMKKQTPREEILGLLRNEGLEETEADELMLTVKKQIANRNLNRGLKCILAGAVFLFAGFFCTLCIHNTTANYDISLYGFTGIGASLIIAGMMYIFG